MDDATLTPEQTTDAMLAFAIVSAEGWAEMTFLTIEGALSCPAADDCGELCRWIGAVTTGTAIDLAENTDQIAVEMGLLNERRHKLVADRSAAYHARLVDLVTTRGPRGAA